MADSKILIALEQFKEEYAWDKSLIVVPGPPPIALPAVIDDWNPLERFQELADGRRSE